MTEEFHVAGLMLLAPVSSRGSCFAVGVYHVSRNLSTAIPFPNGRSISSLAEAEPPVVVYEGLRFARFQKDSP
jgi:hypothetical protein